MIEFRSVSKQFPSGTLAVRDFSLAIPSRQFTVFVGSSGCGKTTILRMINRMVEPTSGQVLIDGDDVAMGDAVKLRRSIGYVMQQSGLLPHRKVIDNVATVPYLRGVPRKKRRADAFELLRTVGLDDSLAYRYPSQLSGGQQQRVGVARALASDPNILVMDEPFGTVDPLVRAELQTELLRLQNELGKTVVFVTHDIDEAFLLGDHVVIFQKGGIIAQQGHPAEILANPASEFVASFIGADRGKRRLTISDISTQDGELVLVDDSGHPAGVLSAGVLSAQGEVLPVGTGPKSRSISNKTDQAGDA